MRSSKTMMLAGIIGALASSQAMQMIPMEPGPDHTPEPEPATVRTRHKPSGSKPVPGGGAKERAKRIAQMEKAAAKARS